MMATFVLDRRLPEYEAVKRRFLDALGSELREGARSVTIAEPKRSNEQNARMWVLLQDLAEQVGYKPARWRGDRLIEDGAYVLLSDYPRARRLTSAQFKDLFTAALFRPHTFAGLYGGVVAFGERTSQMTVRQLTQLMDLIDEFGNERGVIWSAPPAGR